MSDPDNMMPKLDADLLEALNQVFDEKAKVETERDNFIKKDKVHLRISHLPKQVFRKGILK